MSPPRRAKAAQLELASGGEPIFRFAPPDSARVRLESLRPWPGNPRLHPETQIAGLMQALTSFGQVEPLVVQRSTMRLVGGNGRIEAMRRLGWEACEVRFVDLDDARAAALNVALNKLPELSSWDDGLLAKALRELGTIDIPTIAYGFDAEGLKRATEGLVAVSGHERAKRAPAQIVEPASPELPKTPTTKPGDVWELGPHRVGCGDCRDADFVAKLQGGKRVPLVVSDPPYCSGGFQEAGRSAGTFGDIASDQLSTRGYSALMKAAIAAARPRAVYLFTDWRMWIPLFDLIEGSGLPVRSMIVWDKGTPGMGALWRTQHELVMFASREGKKLDKGEAASGNVIQAQRTGNVNHYTEKPVALIAKLLEGDAASPRRECAVFDPFVGSGTTLLAATQLGRTCYALDVEPKWVDVTVQRWEALTGKVARRLGSAEA